MGFTSCRISLVVRKGFGTYCFQRLCVNMASSDRTCLGFHKTCESFLGSQYRHHQPPNNTTRTSPQCLKPRESIHDVRPISTTLFFVLIQLVTATRLSEKVQGQ